MLDNDGKHGLRTLALNPLGVTTTSPKASCCMSLDPSVSGDPIRFRTPNEFRARPLWQDGLHPDEHKPIKIIGDYALPPSDELPCGLKTCRTKHQHGYVIATATGLETHIGRDCGRKHFKVEWGELQSVFDRATEDRDRRLWLEGVMRDRDALVAQAKSLASSIEPLAAQVRQIADRIEKEPLIVQAVTKIVRAGGQVQIEQRVAERTANLMGARGSRNFVQTVARITAIDVLGNKYGGSPGATHINLLTKEVVPFLLALDAQQLAALISKNRKDVARQVEQAKARIQDAERYKAKAEQFLQRANLAGFGRIEVSKPNQRAQRFIDHFRGLADGKRPAA